MKLAEGSQNGSKALWEKEKLLVTSVFKRHVLQTRKTRGLFGKGLKALNDKLLRHFNLKLMKYTRKQARNYK